jgi:hypothetical protein
VEAVEESSEYSLANLPKSSGLSFTKA